MQAKRLLLSTLVPILLAPVVLGFAQDDEIVKEFKKYFRKYKETATRVEAVLSLEGAESVKVVSALLPILKDDDPEVVDASVRVLGSFETRPPVDELLAKLESQKNDRIRLGILRSLAKGGYGDTGEIVTLCLEDKSWEVRRRAVQALVPQGEVHAEGISLLCADKEPAVRCAAIDGLARMGSLRVLEPARAALTDDSWQVRASAIASLGKVRHRDSIEPLLARLVVEEGRLQEDVALALESLTLRSFGLRIELWTRFWDSYKDRYEIPTDEQVAQLRAKQAEHRLQYEAGKATSYHGIETPSRSILFVIDVSGSMENEVVEKERFEEGSYPSYKRIDIVKTELARTIENLESYVQFNILSFATDLMPWKKKLVPANVLNKSSAIDWSLRLQPLGGSSKEELAAVGLVGSANLEAGKTNTYDALRWALGMEEDGDPTEDYEVHVDTIFFLSDGRPTTGRYVNTDDILREVLDANDLRKIVLHTIAIGEFQKTFMRMLAEESGGLFVDLGR